MKTKTTTAAVILSAAAFLFVFASPRAYAQGGIPLWTNSYHGPTNSYVAGGYVAVDGSGNVFVTGSSVGIGSGIDYATIKYSSAGVPLWTNRYTGLGKFDDLPVAIAVDSSGNVLVAGYTTARGDFNDTDYATIKYSNAGVPLWTNLYNGTWIDVDDGTSPQDGASSLAVDSSGNVFVTGYSTGNGTAYDYATIKYSASGVPLWTNRYDGSAHSTDGATAVAVDGSGNVFVTGYSLDNVTDDDYVTIKYSNAGMPLWTNRYDGGAHSPDFAMSLAVDSSGNVIVTGGSESDYFGDPDLQYFDFATVKYSGAGVPLWTNRYISPGYESAYANALAVDASGNVFVSGYVQDTSFQLAQSRDFATVAYSSAGLPLWTNLYNGSDGLDDARSIAVDNRGNVFVTGYTFDTNGINSQFVTIAYSGAGAPLWTNRFHGPANYNAANALVVDGSGNVIVAGWSETMPGNGDFVTIKYSAISPPAVHLTIERDGSTGCFIRYYGSSSFTYRLQRAASVTGPWSNLATNTAPASGLIEYHETNPLLGGGFYRALQP